MATLTLRIKLHKPTKAKVAVYRELSRRVTAFGNAFVAAGRPKGLSSKTAAHLLPASIPSAVVAQALRDAGAAKKVNRFKLLPPCFNNQNLTIMRVGSFWTASFPTQAGRVRVPLDATDQQHAYLEQLGQQIKQGAAKLYEKRGRWFLALSITLSEAPCATGIKIAGIDMGLRNLLVVNIEGETLFVSGDQPAYMRRHYSRLRRRMGQAKALKAIRRMKDKEQRWMKDRDHQISRRVVNWCLTRGVGTIRMEKLSGIRGRKGRRRDLGRSLHSWSFYRLQRFIAYKAELVGIRVEWVNPKYTSQTCPKCGKQDKNNRRGIVFRCVECGAHGHADAIAGDNIAHAISGLASGKPDRAAA